MKKETVKKMLGLVTLLTLSMAVITGCSGKTADEQQSEAQIETATEVQSETQTQEETLELSSEDYAAMGMTIYETVEELQAAVDFEVLTLDTDSALKDFIPEEIALERGVASIRYVKEGDDKQVIILTSGKSETVDTSARSALSDVLIGETQTLVSIAEDEQQQLKSGWWTTEDMTYCIDAFNMEYPDFKALLESFIK